MEVGLFLELATMYFKIKLMLCFICKLLQGYIGQPTKINIIREFVSGSGVYMFQGFMLIWFRITNGFEKHNN